jgi:hypothetical protein
MAVCQATSLTSGHAHRPLCGSTQRITHRNYAAGNVLKFQGTLLLETMIMISNLENKIQRRIFGPKTEKATQE